MWSFRLSDTARAVLWLWHNDKGNWYIGTHAVVHEPTGVGIWTANECCGIHIYYDIPTDDRKVGHACNGRSINLHKRDRKAIYRTLRSEREFPAREVQRQISDWASANIRNDVQERGRVRQYR